MDPMEYAPPTVEDLGDLLDVTAGCIGTGGPDAAFGADVNAFPDTSPAFGDHADFCQ